MTGVSHLTFSHHLTHVHHCNVLKELKGDRTCGDVLCLELWLTHASVPGKVLSDRGWKKNTFVWQFTAFPPSVNSVSRTTIRGQAWNERCCRVEETPCTCIPTYIEISFHLQRTGSSSESYSSNYMTLSAITFEAVWVGSVRVFRLFATSKTDDNLSTCGARAGLKCRER